jgi:hypothetical protein
MDAIDEALGLYPEISRVIGPSPDATEKLRLSWERGAKRHERHPMVELLLNERDPSRARALETGLRSLALPESELVSFRRRVNCEVPADVEKRSAEKDACAALTELYLAGRFSSAGFEAMLLPTSPKGKSPDLEVATTPRPTTLEVQSVFGDDDVELLNDERTESFHAWDPSTPAPPPIKGRASARRVEGGYTKILESEGHPLGEGTLPQKIRRLASRKAKSTPPYAQLSGRTNPILVLSFWHVWGVDAQFCNEVNASKSKEKFSGELYAAAVGIAGDPLYEHFIPGLSLPPDAQIVDGHLVRTNHLAGVLYLFFNGTAALFTNDRPSAPPGEGRDQVRVRLVSARK